LSKRDQTDYEKKNLILVNLVPIWNISENENVELKSVGNIFEKILIEIDESIS
jgi:hypothetical protein